MKLTTHAPSSVEVKNEWSFTSTPPIHFHGVDRENSLYLKFKSYGVNEIAWRSGTASVWGFVERKSFYGNVRTELHTSQMPLSDITNLLSEYVLSAILMTRLKAGV